MIGGLGRAYAVTFSNVTLTNAGGDQDLFYIKPAADKPCVIEAVYLSNVGGTADAADAQEELVRLEALRLPATVTAGSGGTAPTPNPISTNDTAAGFTARVNDTTVATTSGTALSLHQDGWNVRVPYVWMPPPEHRLLVANAQAIVFRLASTLTDDMAANGTMIVRELP
jgi:hypothetical protein